MLGYACAVPSPQYGLSQKGAGMGDEPEGVSDSGTPGSVDPESTSPPPSDRSSTELGEGVRKGTDPFPSANVSQGQQPDPLAPAPQASTGGGDQTSGGGDSAPSGDESGGTDGN